MFPKTASKSSSPSEGSWEEQPGDWFGLCAERDISDGELSADPDISEGAGEEKVEHVTEAALLDDGDE